MILTSQKFYLSFSALLLLSACSGLPVGDASSSSDGGIYRQVENTGELSPEEAHKLARAQVDPVHVNRKNAYVKNVKDSDVQEKVHTRVVTLEPPRKPVQAKPTGRVQNSFKGLNNAVRRADIAPAPSAKPKAASIQPAAGGRAVIQSVRTGEYPDKTRLVFDLTSAVDFEYEIDAAQNVLIVKLNGAVLDTSSERVFKNSRALKAYAAKPAKDGGTLMAVKLKGPSKITGSAKLGKNAAGYNRIYLDVTPL